ncbi:hypothetical protein [Burkholderia cepacia]|uniref:hypothetical protein n=1 Tax=Burkholderia cepacia TaxID=292 RepID=UPI002AB68FCB|nr:hypothetical protein [Burkholderia cepacia]
MSNNYYDATGVLEFSANAVITPVIRALFRPFKLDEDDLRRSPSTTVYIAHLAEDNNTDWETIFASIAEEAQGIGIRPLTDDHDESSMMWLEALIAKFVHSDEGLGDLLDRIARDAQSHSDADLEALYAIAMLCNDGHNLKAIHMEGCWHCSKPRLFEFGGIGEYRGLAFSITRSSTEALRLGSALSAALESSNLDVAAQLVAEDLEKVLAGVTGAEVRSVLRAKVLERIGR